MMPTPLAYPTYIFPLGKWRVAEGEHKEVQKQQQVSLHLGLWGVVNPSTSLHEEGVSSYEAEL